MAAETARISNRGIEGPLSVRAAPGFVRWLVPRLGSFRKAYPQIELHLSGWLRAGVDFATEPVDVNIRWGFEPKPGLASTPLMASTRYPVISPDLLRKGAALECPEDLRHHVLLHEYCPNFEKWFDFAGVSVEHRHPGLRFARYDHVLQAALEGHGVALGLDVIVAGDVEAGRLLRLFDVPYPKRILYSLVTPRSWAERPRIVAFRSWLLGETGALTAAAELMSLCKVRGHVRPRHSLRA